MFLVLATTSSSPIFASCIFTHFRTTCKISSTLVKVTILLSSLQVHLLISLIWLTYFNRKKGGQITTVTYLSVLSTLKRSQMTNSPIDIQVRCPVQTVLQSKRPKQNPYLLVLINPLIFCSFLKFLMNLRSPSTIL